MSNKDDLRKRVVRKRHIKESVQRHNQFSAKKAQNAAKKEHHEAKIKVKHARAALRRAEKGIDKDVDGEKIVDDLEKAKAEVKATRKIKKKVRKTNPTIGQKARRTGKNIALNASHQIKTTAMDQDDTLSDLQNLQYRTRQSKAVAKQAGKVTWRGAKLAYRKSKGMVNVSRGAYRSTKAGAKFATKTTAKAATKTAQVAASAVKTAATATATILANPITWIASAVIGFILFLIIIVSSAFSSNIIQQNDFTLNQSWLHISQVDRQKSSDQVEYYTDIDSILLYMNFRYGGEWEPDANWDDGTGGKLTGALGFNHFSDALDDIWKEENGDIDNLKTMAELYTNGKEWMKLDKDDLADYKEILESQSETGKYLATQELINPFYSADDEKSDTDYLTISKRYGYTSKDEIDPTTTLQAQSGQKLYAVMDGKVSVTTKDLKGNETKTTNLIISDSDARFIYYGVSAIRVKTDDKVEAGAELGTVSGGSQKIAYAKNYGEVDDKDSQWLQDIKNKDVSYGYTEQTKKNKTNVWVLVNPGFYFPFVKYAQTTVVMRTSSELSGRAKQFYDLMKKFYPSATDNGIAAVVGNFAVESSITAKRAEGDYLSPPIGASDGCWDDENWLNMSGTTIYGGGYPNILHRGLGLGQWTDTTDGGTRHTMLINYANSIGKKWYELETQIRFMLEGDSPYYQNILKSVLSSNSDTDSLTKTFLTKWEGINNGTLSQRQSYAKQALSWFHQSIAGGGTMASSWNFPEEYRDKIKSMPTSASMTTQAGSGYKVGQCTWYAYNRLVELGEITDLSGSYGHLGNGQDWVRNLVAKGWHYSTTPSVGAVCSTAGGFDSTYAVYGHVMIVEAVNDDGSFLVSECNYAGNQSQIHWRVCRNAPYYTFATP